MKYNYSNPNLRNQVFEICENMLSGGDMFEETPKQITQHIFENNLLPSNTSPIIVEELIKIWIETNKNIINDPNLPN